MPPAISAIICTYNRADYLSKALASLLAQSFANDRFEIVVVDNASTDNTAQLVKALLPQTPNLQYVYAEKLGLSFARNCGYLAAQGEYVAFLDDDAIASPDWLEKILNAFNTLQPKPGLLGGKVLPIWEAQRPAWLSDQLLPSLSLLDLAEAPLQLNETQYVAGVNMALPRSLLEEVGGFQTNLGRQGQNLLSNEELLLKKKLEHLGYKTAYDPSVFVYHHIPKTRLRPRWFSNRYFWQGISDARLCFHQHSFSARQRLKLVVDHLSSLRKQRRKFPNVFRRLIWPEPNPVAFEVDCYLMRDIGFLIGLVAMPTEQNSIQSKS